LGQPVGKTTANILSGPGEHRRKGGGGGLPKAKAFLGIK